MFEVTTEYDKKALLAMNRAANKTFRRRRYLLRKVFLLALGLWCLVCSCLLLIVFGQLDTGDRVIAVAAAAVGIVSLLEGLFLNRLCAQTSRRQMVEGANRWTIQFGEEGLAGESGDGVQSAYPYSKVRAIYETQEYFLLQIDKLHCIILDKNGFTRGSCEDFRRFIADRTGAALRPIKI